MDDYYRPRSRSQSRRQEGEEEHFVPIDRSHRSKSLDNRREFQRDDDPFYDPPATGGFRDAFHASIPKRQYERRFGGGGDDREGDGFFNETITIPRSTVKVSPTHRAMDADKNELNWASYDKSSRYTHERTGYPPPPPPQYPPYYRYEEYGGGDRLLAPPQPAEISPRSYPESDYYQRTQQVQRGGGQFYDGRSVDAASAYRTDQRFYEEERERAERAERERAERVIREQRELEERSRRETTQVASATKNGKNGHGHHHQASGYQYQSSGYSRGGGGASAIRGGRRGVKPERDYHRITCCCFRFYWPPWGYEHVEPVQPWYPNPRPISRAGSPSPPLPIEKQPR